MKDCIRGSSSQLRSQGKGNKNKITLRIIFFSFILLFYTAPFIGMKIRALEKEIGEKGVIIGTLLQAEQVGRSTIIGTRRVNYCSP